MNGPEVQSRVPKRLRIRIGIRTILVLVMLFAISFSGYRMTLPGVRSLRYQGLGVLILDESKIWDETQIEYLKITAKRAPRWKGTREGLFVQRIPFDNLRSVARFRRLKSLHLTATTMEDLTPLSSLQSLEELNLDFTYVVELQPVRHVRQLRRLDLAWTDVADISPLAHLNKLEVLDLGRTRVSDISVLRRLKKLRMINLAYTKVDNFEPLTHLDHLTHLDLSGVPLTTADLQQLNADLPRCKIERR